MPPLGAIIGLVVLAGLALWAIVAFIRRRPEKPTEATSHYESGIGPQAGGPPDGSA
jgi:hypothetical protein